MFYFVIANTTRNRKPHYRLVKVYRKFYAMEKWLIKEGKPVWILENHVELLPVNNLSDPIMLGGRYTYYWNSGGWSSPCYMPELPLVTDTRRF